MFCLCLMESERRSLSEGVCGTEGKHEAVKQELVFPLPLLTQGSHCSLLLGWGQRRCDPGELRPAAEPCWHPHITPRNPLGWGPMHGVISMTLAWISSPLRRAHPACSVQVTYFLPPRLSQYRRTHVISTQCLRESVKVGASLPGPSREGLCRVALGSSEASPRVVANDHIRPPAWHCWGKWQRLASAPCLGGLVGVPAKAACDLCGAGAGLHENEARWKPAAWAQLPLQRTRRQLPSSRQGSWQPEGIMGWLCAPTPPGQLGDEGGTALATSPGLGSKRCS